MSEQKPRILVVEDEPQVAAEICVRLEALGYEPIGPVDTAAKALQSASLQAPDLVLMDIVLPGGMDGVQAAAELLRQCIPVVYLTAYADDDLLHRAKITAPLGYLIKPFTDRELQAAIVMAMYRCRVEREKAEFGERLAQTRNELEHKVAERTEHLQKLNQRLRAEMSERARVEQSLRESEQKYRALLENAVDAILLANIDGQLLDANRRAEQMLGYSRDELLHIHASNLHPAEENELLLKFFGELAQGRNTLVEHAVLRKDGGLLRVEVAATPIQLGDHIVVQGIFRDVTERRQHEAERLRHERAHRNTLIREVHHRIKNNLQGVIGLMHRHVSAHPELEEPMNAVMAQVQSISVVHGLQGQGEDTQLRLCDMVREIANNAGMLVHDGPAPVLQLTRQQPIIVGKEEAVAVALIINELLLNAIKHSPPGAAEVHIEVNQAGSEVEVTIINPGQLPEEFDFAANIGRGTGLDLVCSLLPMKGAQLKIVQLDENVKVCLRLMTPVLSI